MFRRLLMEIKSFPPQSSLVNTCPLQKLLITHIKAKAFYYPVLRLSSPTKIPTFASVPELWDQESIFVYQSLLLPLSPHATRIYHDCPMTIHDP
ncbi:hypothetical protein WG66_003100 [Moniliophthora roreri]|nr:hypothetical protein WG66_003100 [Moniliophthora roreri]